MERFIINGRRPLAGEIEVRGSKNAANPILAATLLTSQPCYIDNLPLIEDVFRMLEILESLGSEIEWLAERKIKIQTKNIDIKNLNQDIVSRLRSSVLLFGALAARLTEFSLAKPGGCNLGSRSLDPHIQGLSQIGLKIKQENKNLTAKIKKILGAKIVLSERSVTATENLILAAVLAQGETIISNAAAEPHVQDLCIFLNKMGAKIKGIGENKIFIRGVKKINGAKHYLSSDPIETGTFISLAAAVPKSKLLIKNIQPEFLELELLKFQEAGVRYKLEKNQITVYPSVLRALKKIHNMPYPGFAPDLLPPLAVLMTQAQGTTLIHDWMYEARQKYANELKRMGAEILIADPHRIFITGPNALRGKEIQSYDVRAGASLIIAGLIAQGQTIIEDTYPIDRGYEKIEKRLQKIGADMIRN